MSTAEPGPRPRRRRGWWAALALVTACTGLWLAAPWIVERMLIARLEAQGFAGAALDVRRVGPFETRIEGLRLPAVSAERVTVRYTPLAALRGDLYAVLLEGLSIEGGARETALSLVRAEQALRTASGLRIAHIEFGEARVALAAPGGDWNATLRGALVQTASGALEGAVSVVATSTAGAFGGELRLAPDAEGRTAASLRVREAVIRLPGLTLESLAGDISIGRSGGPLPVFDFDLQAGGRAPDGTGLERARLRLVSEGATAFASLAGIDLEGRRFTVESAFDVTGGPEGAALRLSRPGSLSFLDRPVRNAAPLSLDVRIEPGDEPALRLLAAPDGIRLVHALRLALRPTMVATAAGPARIEGGQVAIDGTIGPEGTRGQSEARIPRLVLTASGIRAEGVRLTVHWEEGPPRFELAADRLAPSADPPWFAPVPVLLSGTGTLAGARFAGTIGGAPGQPAMEVEGETAGIAAGRARLRLRPVDLARPGALAALSPAAARVASETRGSVAARWDLAWAPDGARADGRVLLRDVAGTLPFGRIERLNGVVALDRMAPLSTVGPQTVSVGLADVGLPLTDGTLTFQLENGQPALTAARFDLAGGLVTLTEATLSPAFDGALLTLEAAGLDLGPAAGDGRFSGPLPVEITREHVRIRAARPATAAAPAFRSDATGEAAAPSVRAATGFTLDRPHGGRPRLTGSDGPLDFLADLAQRLDRYVRGTAERHRVPEATRRQMQAFGEP
ncbi:hypothetical protein STVA_23680 [Allostella vacuolata]|nr:hypothetical protein STVA_23680 [Stella vacuolata]